MKLLKEDIKKNHKRLLLDLLIIFLLLFCCWQLYKIGKIMVSDGGKCLRDPLKFYNEELVGDDTCYITCIGGRVLGGEYNLEDKKYFNPNSSLP